MIHNSQKKKGQVFVLIYCLFTVIICFAQDEEEYAIKDRWLIDVMIEKTPAFFTYIQPDGSAENFFYFVLRLAFNKTFLDEYKKERPGIPVTNPEGFVKTFDEAPLQYLDIKLICSNAVKVLTKKGENEHSIYEYEYTDYVLTPVINKKVEYKILENILKIRSYPSREKIKFIKKKKRKGEFLNLSELRFIKKYIKKGEEVSVLVYIRNFPVRTTAFKIVVTGITYPVRIAIRRFSDINDIANVSSLSHLRSTEAERIAEKVLAIKRFEIENRYVVIDYDFRGDPYERHLDMPKFKGIKTVSKKISGTTDIQTLEKLLNIVMEDKLFINKVTAFNLLKILLPREIFPECLVHRDERELKYSTKEEALNSRELKCVPKNRTKIIEIASQVQQSNKLAKLEIPNIKMICLKEFFDELCMKELKFNWLRLKDKLIFNPSTYSYEIIPQ